LKALSAEALAEWRGSPVTQFLLAVLSKGAAANSEALKDSLWRTGECDDEHRGRVKAQVELVEDLTEAEAEDWNDWAKHFGVVPDGIQGDR